MDVGNTTLQVLVRLNHVPRKARRDEYRNLHSVVCYIFTFKSMKEGHDRKW